MRFPIPLIVEVPDDQLARWAEAAGVAEQGTPRAKDAVEGVRAQVVAAVRRDFAVLGIQVEVSVKGWTEPASNQQLCLGPSLSTGGGTGG